MWRADMIFCNAETYMNILLRMHRHNASIDYVSIVMCPFIFYRDFMGSIAVPKERKPSEKECNFCRYMIIQDSYDLYSANHRQICPCSVIGKREVFQYAMKLISEFKKGKF